MQELTLRECRAPEVSDNLAESRNPAAGQPREMPSLPLATHCIDQMVSPSVGLQRSLPQSHSSMVAVRFPVSSRMALC